MQEGKDQKCPASVVLWLLPRLSPSVTSYPRHLKCHKAEGARGVITHISRVSLQRALASVPMPRVTWLLPVLTVVRGLTVHAETHCDPLVLSLPWVCEWKTFAWPRLSGISLLCNLPEPALPVKPYPVFCVLHYVCSNGPLQFLSQNIRATKEVKENITTAVTKLLCSNAS